MTLYEFALIFSLLTSPVVDISEQEALNYIENMDKTYTSEAIIDINKDFNLEVKLEDILKKAQTPKEEIKLIKDSMELKLEYAHEEVPRLKKFFQAMGYTNLSNNSFFDQRLRDVAMDYQRKNGLSVDGIIGVNTYKKINEDILKNSIALPELKISFSQAYPKGNLVIINKSNNTLYHIIDGQIAGSYPVATGKTVSHTPDGKFTIVIKLVDPAWGGAGRYTPVKGGAPNNPLGKRWLGLNIGGGGTYGIHGNADKSSIGKYISLGCIRMFNEDVVYLYERLNNQTPVWIGSESKLLEYGVSFQY